MTGATEAQRTLIAGLPVAVRAAIEEADVQALDLALRALPPDEAARVLASLVQAGLLARRSDADLDAEQAAAFGKDEG